MRTAVALALLLLSSPSRAGIEPPEEPRQVELAIRILKDPGASEAAKMDALTWFTKTINLTDEAFWTLLATAGDESREPDAVRIAALHNLSSAISYILPDDVERGEHAVALMLDEKFKAAFAAMGSDRSPEFRAKWLHFFGAVTLNMPAPLTRPLGPAFLPMLLSRLAAETDPTAMNEGLWSLGRLLEIQAVTHDQVAPALRRIAMADTDEGVREIAREMLYSRGAFIN